jgi:hypothetical protein
MEKFDWKRPIRANILKLKIVGLWPPGDDSYKPTWYTLWAFFCITVFNLGPNIFQTANIVFIFDDLEAVISNIFLTLSELLSTLKAYYVVQNMTVLKQLMVSLNSDSFQPRNQRQLELVAPGLKFWKVNYVLYWTITLGAVFFLSTYPILDKSVQDYRLPFMAWYPFDTRTSPVYEITYCYQILGMACSAATALSVDTLIAALNVYIGAQVEILCDNVRHLRGDHFNEELVACVQHHKEIIKYWTDHLNLSSK